MNTDIKIFILDGVKMVDTVTIANVCRNGKTNNVYRMAKGLVEKGEQGIIDLGGRPAKCAMSQRAFGILASRFTRRKDRVTAIGVIAINNAFDTFANDITANPMASADKAIATRTKMECAPLVADITKDINEQFADAMESKAAEIADVQIDEIPFEEASVEMKMGWRISNYIEETQNRINRNVEVMFDALRDVVSDMMCDVTNVLRQKDSDLETTRSELDALRRMIKPAQQAARIQTLKGNVSVQQCAAWLTSNGIKGIGEIRLYEWMRNKGLVCTDGASRNLPTQIALEKGLLVTVSNPYTNPKSGEIVNAYTTRVTPKGQSYLFNRLMFYQTQSNYGKL